MLISFSCTLSYHGLWHLYIVAKNSKMWAINRKSRFVSGNSLFSTSKIQTSFLAATCQLSLSEKISRLASNWLQLCHVYGLMWRGPTLCVDRMAGKLWIAPAKSCAVVCGSNNWFGENKMLALTDHLLCLWGSVGDVALNFVLVVLPSLSC